MLTKGFHSVFYHFMAKSQYTDLIDPNNVVVGEYYLNDKLYIRSAGKILVNRVQYSVGNSGGKFYSKTFSPTKSDTHTYSEYTIELKNYSNKFTYSYWIKFAAPVNSMNPGMGLHGDNGLYFNTSIVGATAKIANQIYQDNNWGSWSSASTVSSNTWVHVATTYENKTLKTYLNGQLVVTNTDSKYTLNTKNMKVFKMTSQITQVYTEDFTVIKDQILWTNNFTVPNYILLGDPEPAKRISNRNKVWPVINLRGDYFDKAFLY